MAAALALEAAASGQRVLAVDVVNDGGLRASLEAAPEAIPRTLELLELSPEESLREYIRLYLKVPIPAKRLGPISRIFDYVATAAPGVREILTIGKVANEVRRGPWDLVVVDGPATGHLVELLAAADNLGELIGFGPLADQTEWMSELLADPAITGVVVVTLPSELPVSETLELLTRLDEDTDVATVGLVINRVPPLVDPAVSRSDHAAARSAGNDGLARAVEIVGQRSETANGQLERLAVVDLPTLRVEASATPVDAARSALRRGPR